MSSPILSVVIPTKNRYQYLSHLIDFFTTINDDRIEMVIQDNSDEKSDDFVHKVSSLEDNRIKYFYYPQHISVVENCDKAILNSSGKYVCMLGDDDGFLPELIFWVEKMQEKNIEVLIPEKAHYSWPDIENKYHNLSGLLRYTKHNDDLKMIDVEKELKGVLSYGGTFMFNMPRLYHAVVERKTLNKIYDKTGTFFPGPSPDMANAVALSLLSPRTYYIKKPIIISGKGFKSTGGQGLRHAHIGKIEDIKHLPSNTAIEWERNIPRIWTGQTIYAESIIKSLKRCSREDLVKNFNFLRNYANFTGKHYRLFKMVRPYIKWYQYPLFAFYVLLFFKLRVDLFLEKKLKKLKSKKSDDLISIKNISDIQSAIAALQKRM